jgi:predicted amidohydrolase
MSARANTVRVAAVQFAVGSEVDANLAICLRMLEAAANRDPELVVLPEFCNHLSWYDGPEHCYEVSLEPGGPFVRAIADKAKQLGVYAVFNATVRRPGGGVTGTSMLVSPRGELLGATDKQVLIGHENDFLRRAETAGPIVGTPIGRIAMYACMDGVINETPRCLALRGAQILCNSLNSFARDEASLHIPVRAPENRVFIVAANKVGPLIPAALLAPVSQQTSIPIEFLSGAGESQIMAPDGRVLAMAPRTGEAIVTADIDPRAADDKRRPDGTDVFAARRPALYAPIGADPATQPRPAPRGADAVMVATVQLAGPASDAITEAASRVREAAAGGAELVVLPELFCHEGGVVDDPEAAVLRSRAAIAALAAACGEATRVCTSLVLRDGTAYRHSGVLLGAAGVELVQHQLHPSARRAWATPGDGVVVAELAWGRFGIAVGDDSIYPETFRLLALAGAEVVAVPLRALEPWETATGLVERSAENRVCVVAANGSAAHGTSLLTTLQRDFTIMTPWHERTFDGLLSHPIATRAAAGAGVLRAIIHPRNAENKIVSHRTDLLAGRPWKLVAPITSGAQETPHG